MDPRAEAAARNNAGWCDLVCRSHGVPTITSGQVWRAFRRSPPLYPDAVTLGAGVTDDDLVAGGIGVRHAGVVGLCNVFTVSAGPDLVWAGLADAVSDRFPGLPLVGYEHGPDLTSARNAGFTSAGPLRVWLTTAGTGHVPHPSR